MTHQIITLPSDDTYFYNNISISLGSGCTSYGCIKEHVFPSGEHKIELIRVADSIRYFTIQQTNLPDIPIFKDLANIILEYLKPNVIIESNCIKYMVSNLKELEIPIAHAMYSQTFIIIDSTFPCCLSYQNVWIKDFKINPWKKIPLPYLHYFDHPEAEICCTGGMIGTLYDIYK